jgi:5-methylcytosine-specific restriction protein A
MASLAGLTAAAVKASAAECDRLGESAFLAKHGFRPSKSFELVIDGQRYPSKAIVGAALGLASSEFSGGLATVGRTLNKLGFSVERKEERS